MTKKNIRTAKRWAFPITVAAFVILQIIIKGDCLATLWALTAAAFHLIACFFEETCDDLLQANRDLAEALKEEQAKNAELQEEINRLKN